MSERQKAACERAYGPYKHGNRWRVRIIGADGKPIGRNPDGSGGPPSFETEAKASEFISKFNAGVDARTIGEAVTAYLEATKSVNENTNEVVRHRLNGLLGLPANEGRLLRAFTASLASELYTRRTEKVAVATHHSELRYAGRCFDWFVERGWLKFNPWANVKSVGVPNRGKPRLRIDPSRKLMEHLMADRSAEATAVLTALLLGMRATEVIERTVSELDAGGRLLWISSGTLKTKNAEREIEVPDSLRWRLLELAKGKGPDERLFGSMTRYALHYHTVRLCKEAGVPRVTPHGLRGTSFTNKVRLGVPLVEVARDGGHGDDGTTARRHYLDGGAEMSARGRALEELLLGKGTDSHFPTDEKGDLN